MTWGMKMIDKSATPLDALLAEIACLQAVPSDAVQEKMMADARAVVAENVVAMAAPLPAARGLFGGLSALIGGWAAVGGLTACIALGVGLGVSKPAGLTGLFGTTTQDVVSVSLGVDANPLSLLGG